MTPVRESGGSDGGVISLNDSGGGTFATIDGEEVLVGVHSTIDDSPCGSGKDGRIDRGALDLIDEASASIAAESPPDAAAPSEEASDAPDGPPSATAPGARSTSSCAASPSRERPPSGGLAVLALACLALGRRGRRKDGRRRLNQPENIRRSRPRGPPRPR